MEWRRGCWEAQANLLLSRWGKRGPERPYPGHAAAIPMPLLPKSSLCAIKWIQRLHISIQTQNPCSFSTSSSQLGNCHPISQVTEILIHVGLLLDLSRLPPGWQLWSLRDRHDVNLFWGSPMTLYLGVMQGWGLPSQKGRVTC